MMPRMPALDRVTDPLYPRLSKLGLLRSSRSKSKKLLVVSTAGLHEHLGEKKYQECCRVFKYQGQCYRGPRPDEIEQFLRRLEKGE